MHFCFLWHTSRIGQEHPHAATHHQSKIGWFGLLTGRVSKRWTDAQRRYYSCKNLTKLPARWTAALIKLSFQIAWDMWKDRCDVKHSTPTAATQRELAKLDQEMDELRQVSTNDISGHDAKHLEMDDYQQRNMSLDEKCEWIAKAEAIHLAHFDHIQNLPQTATDAPHRITDWTT